MPATIIHIPAMFCKPPSDPRDPAVVDKYELPTDEQWERLAAQDGLMNLIRKYGARRVMTWVRSLATIAGQEVS